MFKDLANSLCTHHNSFNMSSSCAFLLNGLRLRMVRISVWQPRCAVSVTQCGCRRIDLNLHLVTRFAATVSLFVMVHEAKPNHNHLSTGMVKQEWCRSQLLNQCEHQVCLRAQQNTLLSLIALPSFAQSVWITSALVFLLVEMLCSSSNSCLHTKPCHGVV